MLYFYQKIYFFMFHPSQVPSPLQVIKDNTYDDIILYSISKKNRCGPTHVLFIMALQKIQIIRKTKILYRTYNVGDPKMEKKITKYQRSPISKKKTFKNTQKVFCTRIRLFQKFGNLGIGIKIVFFTRIPLVRCASTFFTGHLDVYFFFGTVFVHFFFGRPCIL